MISREKHKQGEGHRGSNMHATLFGVAWKPMMWTSEYVSRYNPCRSFSLGVTIEQRFGWRRHPTRQQPRSACIEETVKMLPLQNSGGTLFKSHGSRWHHLVHEETSKMSHAKPSAPRKTTYRPQYHYLKDAYSRCAHAISLTPLALSSVQSLDFNFD